MFHWANDGTETWNYLFQDEAERTTSSASQSSRLVDEGLAELKAIWNRSKTDILTATNKVLYSQNGGQKGLPKGRRPSKRSLPRDTACTTGAPTNPTDQKIGLSGETTDILFPYHIMVDPDLTIVQVGKDLPGLLHTSPEALKEQNVADILHLKRPSGVTWTWDSISTLQGRSFDLVPLEKENLPSLSFRATLVHISPTILMLILTPNAHTFQELDDMNLTIDNLPLHGGYRDAVFLSEHLSSQLNNGVMVEKLTRHLEKEKKLLESLLPTHAAEDLRKGKLVKPMVHENVTFFFSDIVGFTSICDQLYTWQVIEMLNRLYCIMDFLAVKFGLFKVETIGDGTSLYGYKGNYTIAVEY